MACGLDTTHGIKFYPWLAKRTSVNAAIIAQQIYYWQCRKGGGRIHEGKRWVFNTYKQWAEQTALSEREVEGAVKLLENLGALNSLQLDKANYSRVKFYRIDKSHPVFEDPGEDPIDEQESNPVQTGIENRPDGDQPPPQRASLNSDTPSDITTDTTFSVETGVSTAKVKPQKIKAKPILAELEARLPKSILPVWDIYKSALASKRKSGAVSESVVAALLGEFLDSAVKHDFEHAAFIHGLRACLKAENGPADNERYFRKAALGYATDYNRDEDDQPPPDDEPLDMSQFKDMKNPLDVG